MLRSFIARVRVFEQDALAYEELHGIRSANYEVSPRSTSGVNELLLSTHRILPAALRRSDNFLRVDNGDINEDSLPTEESKE